MAEPEIEGYTDLVEVGRGGFGVVYRARQDRFDRVVALKLVSADEIDRAAQRRFERECRAMGGLSWHPNVVAIHDSGVDGRGRPWLAMEFLEDGSLGDRIASSGPLAPQEVATIGVKTAGALAAAHANGVLHRDMKPENLLVAPFGEVKLSDFGIAVVEGATGTTVGGASFSVAHVAPEVLDDKPADERSDVYGMGSTLHMLLTGTPPFVRSEATSLAAVVGAVLNSPPPRIEGVPEPLADLVQAALAKDPAARPSSAEELGRRLQEVQAACGWPVTELRVSRSGDGEGPSAGAPATGAARVGDPSVTVAVPAVGAPPGARSSPEGGWTPAGDSRETVHVEGPIGPLVGAPEAPADASDRSPGDAPAGVSPAGGPAQSSPARPKRGLVVAGAVAVVAVVAGAIALAGRSTGDGSAAVTTEAGRAPTVVESLAIDGAEEVGDLEVVGGSLVVSSEVAGNLTVVDPESGQVLEATVLDAPPTDLTVSDGAIVAALGEANEVVAIDPASLEVQQQFVAGPLEGAGAVVLGRVGAGEGAVWVTQNRAGVGGEAIRLDADVTGALESVILGPTVLAADVTVGEGSAWVVANDRIVRRIDGFSNTVSALIPVSEGGAGQLVVSAGVLWVAGRDVAEGAAAVSHIDPATNTVTETIPVPGGSAGFVAAGLGAVWVSTESGVVARIDPETLEVTDTVEIDGGAGPLAVGAGSVWVAVPGTDTVARIDPGTG